MVISTRSLNKSVAKREVTAGAIKLAYIGVRYTFHPDNGQDFCKQLLTKVMHKWSQNVTFVNGHPRHSQSQGLMEHVNILLEEKIDKMKADRYLQDKLHWMLWLPKVMYSMKFKNTEYAAYTQQEMTVECLPLYIRPIWLKIVDLGCFRRGATED